MAFAAVPASAATAATPTMHILGTPTGYVTSTALAVNNLGTAVGYATDANGVNIAVKWPLSGTPVELANLPGYDVSEAAGINDLGQLVGTAESSSNGNTHAVEWSAKGVVSDLGAVPGKLTISQAYGINDLGEAVGYDQSAGRVVGATSWYHGTINDFGGGSQDIGENGATAINDLGEIVGYDFALHGSGSAVVWHNDVGQELPDLPFDWGPTHANASAVNNLGEIVGISPANGIRVYHAVRWDPQGNVFDLGTLPGGRASDANGVNDFGVVAGGSDDGTNTYAVIWNRNGTPTALPGANGDATAISDTGFIVGTIADAAGNTTAVRWF